MINWANAASELGALAIVLLGFALFVWAIAIKDPPLFITYRSHKDVMEGCHKTIVDQATVIGEQKREIRQQNVDFVRVTGELAKQGDIFSRFVDVMQRRDEKGG